MDASTPPGRDVGPTCDPVANCLGKQCGPNGCGTGNCGTAPCGDGLTCNAAGQCVTPPTCDPECGDDQYCDSTQADPLCIEICNAPNGCAASETCVHDTATTGHCAPPTCGGVECEEGQVCVDFGTEQAPDEKCSCIPADTFEVGGVVQPDSCPSGFVCSMGPVESQEDIVPSECRKPGEWEDCVKTVGCADGNNGAVLECTSDVYQGSLCLQKCGQNADASGATPHTEKCADPALACRAVGNKAFCTYNFCIDMCQGAGCFTDTQRAKLFQPCTGAALNDSTCQPGAFQEGATVYEYGLCVQAGGATSRGKCYPDATRLSDPTFATMCPINQACMGVHPTTASDSWTGQVGECIQMCNAYAGSNPAPSPVANCTDENNNYCMDVTGVPSLQKTILGFCLDKCDMFGTDTCPDNNVGDHQGCYPEDWTGTKGYCRGLMPNAAGLGETCVVTTDENEGRNECGARMICLQYTNQESGFCSGMCQSTATGCTNPEQACSQCMGKNCCQKTCAANACGMSDGCGGTCGCEAGKTCTANACVACTTTCEVDKCGMADTACGGTCKCSGNKTCDANGDCQACVPNCDGKVCGDDGCGGTCGEAPCADGKSCVAGQCVTCVPNCINRTCGDDGCGGSCGACNGVCATVDQGKCAPVFTDEQGQPMELDIQVCTP